jgi:hypothetical protein
MKAPLPREQPLRLGLTPTKEGLVGERSEIGPELAARHTMASAVLGDFHDAVDAYRDDGAKPPDYAMWAERLATALSELLDGIDDPGTDAGIAYPAGGWISGPST